jgi:DNA-binding FadR family transcriptional regulator
MGRLVAEQLLDEIIEAGWPVGRVLGSEPEMLARFGVSAPVLREAVRLLEHQSVAYGRRGPGGGLVVRAPDADVSVKAMTLYLAYRGFSARDILAVRDAIELGCFERVVTRVRDEKNNDVVRGLRKALEEPGGQDTHASLAALSGNSVLAAFLVILEDLWDRHAMSTPEEWRERALDGSGAHDHELIIRALLDGDFPLARLRMRRHLQAATSWCRWPAADSTDRREATSART